MRRRGRISAWLVGAAVVGALHLCLRVPTGELDALSATLDRRITEHASRAGPRPPLYGETVPGVAIDLYREALSKLAPQISTGGTRLLGQSRDQIVSDEIFGLVTRGARAERLGPPGAPLDRRFIRRAFSELQCQIASEAVWLQRERLKARRGATSPVGGPSFLFHVERVLACLRMADDLAVAGLAGRDDIAGGLGMLIRSGLHPTDLDSLDPEEASAFARGFEIWLENAPGTEELEEELDLVVQTRLRAFIRGRTGPFVLDHRIRDAFATWKALRERPVHGWTSSGSAPPEAAGRRQLPDDLSPAEWMQKRRSFRRRIESYVLALHAFLRWEELGAAPESVDEIRPPAVRTAPDGGRWDLVVEGNELTVRWTAPPGTVGGSELSLARYRWSWRSDPKSTRRR